MSPLDTADPRAAAAQIAFYQRLGPAGRVDLASRLSEDARAISRSGIGARHPEYSGAQIEQALRRLVLGDTLYRKAWPDRQLLDP